MSLHMAPSMLLCLLHCVLEGRTINLLSIVLQISLDMRLAKLSRNVGVLRRAGACSTSHSQEAFA